MKKKKLCKLKFLKLKRENKKLKRMIRKSKQKIDDIKYDFGDHFLI